jgi:hypothetical protein
MALWCEDRDRARADALPLIFASQLLGPAKKKNPRDRAKSRKR